MACEHEYGIYRDAEISSFPDVECIRRVLVEAAARNIETTAWDIDQAQHPEAATEVRSTEVRYELEDGSWARLRISETKQHKVLFSHYHAIVEQHPRLSQRDVRSEIDATRELMLKVEDELESVCAMQGLRAGIREKLVGIDAAKVSKESD